MAGKGKKKIEIKKIEKESERMVRFSKRKQGLFKKANKLNELSSASQIAILLFSPAGNPFTSLNAQLFDAAISRYLRTLELPRDESTDASSSGSGLMRLKYSEVESVLLGEGGCDCSDEKEKDSGCIMKEWVKSIDVEGVDEVEDLIVMKQRLESIKQKLMNKDSSSSSFFV